LQLRATAGVALQENQGGLRINLCQVNQVEVKVVVAQAPAEVAADRAAVEAVVEAAAEAAAEAAQAAVRPRRKAVSHTAKNT
jgi:hypothetical protein